MGFFKREKTELEPAVLPGPVQLRDASRHPFRMMDGYVPLHSPSFGLYRAIREAIPVVDAAILKLIRLTGGVSAVCGDPLAQRQLNEFLAAVDTGWGQKGIQSFLDCYLDSLLTCGRAVGEIVPDRTGRDIAAVLCGNVSQVEIRENSSPLDYTLSLREEAGARVDLPRQDLLLFTPLHPSPEAPWGVSLLHAAPFLADILMKIFQTLGTNWERAGNLRFAVLYKPQSDGMDRSRAQERGELLARQWSEAMQNTKAGSVRDFVAVGDVEIKVIGAESEIPDCQIPIRLLVEQLISQTGIPPFLLGLNWSSTERMSVQQADMMTSEITAFRRALEPTLEKICRMWLRMHGYGGSLSLQWEEINLQDEVEEAKAELYRQQAKKLELEMEATV